ncbi:aldo/keto reductase [Leptospira sp. GIMC2001]|uniref:aldo/keto reductase n=1 Tax=Leptospira sp. GIMC2001 TaxID=1513297 RepID=UPI00234A6994|nr:aldo/keto reductase [Leptospira sp. GIMC2001]WCL49381.1 aldo/keto reductase [Leptospira sp. GIMC2001]
MEYRNLGRTDIKVSALCLGTMTWGKQNTESEGHEQMDYALDRGINFFDTAEMYAVPPAPDTYGKTETIIGTWFAKKKNRDQVILASKIAGPGLRWIRGGDYKIDRKNILEALEGSLKRLQTDYIDLYQLHWPNRGSYHFGQFWDYNPNPSNTEEVLENFNEVLETLNDLIKQGKIRNIGLSNETAWGTMNYLRIAKEKGFARVVSIQNEYSLLYQLHSPDLAEVSIRENVGLLAWSPLASGMLTGKYANGKIPAGSRWTMLRKHNQRNTKQAHDAVNAYHSVAKKHGIDPSQMSLAYVTMQPFVTSNIIGATSMDQLKQNIDSINLKLNDEVLKDLQEVRKDYPIPY